MKLKDTIKYGLIGVLISTSAFAGNDTKKGQGGVVELLVNPWARSAGFSGANTGLVRGIESMGLNIAGLAYVRKTEFTFSNTNYLVGSNININTIGFAQRVGDAGVMGLCLSAFDLGTFYETTEDHPNGTGNTFKPQIFNFGLSYSKTFSNRITGGILVRGISQNYNSASAFGVAFDAGIQYQTGPRKEFKFGVSLMNLGSKLSFGGDALATRGQKANTSYAQTIDLKAAAFEQSSMLNIGVGYDFHFDTLGLKITPCFNFRSNSFTSDQYQAGLQVSWNDMFMLRGGYDFQEGILSKSESTTSNLGPAFGATFQMPFTRSSTGDMQQGSRTGLFDGGLKSKILALDYSYSTTRYFSGTHRISLTLTL